MVAEDPAIVCMTSCVLYIDAPCAAYQAKEAKVKHAFGNLSNI
jgi:hypothetical protein